MPDNVVRHNVSRHAEQSQQYPRRPARGVLPRRLPRPATGAAGTRKPDATPSRHRRRELSRTRAAAGAQGAHHGRRLGNRPRRRHRFRPRRGRHRRQLSAGRTARCRFAPHAARQRRKPPDAAAGRSERRAELPPHRPRRRPRTRRARHSGAQRRHAARRQGDRAPLDRTTGIYLRHQRLLALLERTGGASPHGSRRQYHHHFFDPGFPAVVVPDRLRRIEKRRRGVHPLAGQTARTEGNPRQLGRSRPRLDTVAGERRAAAREYPRFRKPDTAGACRATRRSSAELRLSRLRRVELHYRPDHRRHGRTLHSLNPATMRTPAAHPDRLTAEERRELDDNAFGIPSRREFPLVDAAHVRAAESYFRYAPEADKPALARRILRQAAEFGIEIRSETILRWAAQTAKR